MGWFVMSIEQETTVTPLFLSAGYVETKVEASEIAQVRLEMKSESRSVGILAGMKYRYLKELQLQQKSGLHFAYLEYENAQICTCGLTIFADGFEVEGEKFPVEFIPEIAAQSLAPLALEDVQRATGHLQLPSASGQSIALIIFASWHQPSRENLWSAYCQRCLSTAVEISNKEAKQFVRNHNKSCMEIAR